MWFRRARSAPALRFAGSLDSLAESIEARFVEGAALVRLAARRAGEGGCELALVERETGFWYLASVSSRRDGLRLDLRRFSSSSVPLLIGSMMMPLAGAGGPLPAVWLIDPDADGNDSIAPFRGVQDPDAAARYDWLRATVQVEDCGEGLEHCADLLRVGSEDSTSVLIEAAAKRGDIEGPSFLFGTGASRQSGAEDGVRNLLESLPLPATLWDARQTVRGCNARFSELMGLNEENIRGMGLAQLERGLGAERFEASVLSATGALYRMGERGRQRFIQPVPIPLLSGGEAERLVVYFDWSAVIEMEELAGRVSEAVPDGITVARILQEIGNIATVLGGALPVIREQRAEELPEVVEDLESTQAAARDLLGRLRANFMDLEQGRLGRVDVGVIAARVARLHRHPSVICALEMDVGVELECDPRQCERALAALVSNAVEASLAHPPAAGRPTVSISLRRLGADHAVLIEVRDTGPGMPSAFLDARTWDGRAQAPGAGIGIGLRTVAEFVAEMRGSINAWNDNDPDGGAVVTIRIPVRSLRPHAYVPQSSQGVMHSADAVVCVVARPSRRRSELLRRLNDAGRRAQAFDFPVNLRSALQEERPATPAVVFCEEGQPGSFDSQALDEWLLRSFPQVPYVSRPDSVSVPDIVAELLAAGPVAEGASFAEVGTSTSGDASVGSSTSSSASASTPRA